MLTSYQCEVVAFIGDGFIVCADDGHKRLDQGEAEGLQPLIRYTVDDEFPEGLNCEDCGEEITEPAEDYCQAHDSWRAWNRGKGRGWCDSAQTADGSVVDIVVARECSSLRVAS